ncbi:MAG TPA: protoporphyrinogen oxidase [Actinomycetota bacterium]|nr:protoporphyrinogen oxidase [Actinomycetota bacterium]
MTAAGARVVVVGGGVSGLTTAYRLVTRDPSLDVVVLEASERPGGKLATVEVAGLTLPAGADAFLARKPWAVDLCRELGLGKELVAPATTGAHLWTDEGLVPFLPESAFGIPGDVGDVMRWPGVSPKGRRRALQDLLIRKRKHGGGGDGDAPGDAPGDDGGDETLGSLLRRRLGDEATDSAVAPLLAGLYAGDVDRLSARATFPELLQWESWQGSLIRGAQAARRQTRRAEAGPVFLRPRAGVHALTDALADRLDGRVRTNATVETVLSRGGRWHVRTADGHDHGADAVVVAAEAHTARRVLAVVARGATDDLEAIPAASTAVVLLVYDEGTRDALPDGTGFVVPRGKAPMTAATWLSNKWPHESFGSRAVVRCYVGAAGIDEVVDEPDDDIVEACARHLAAAVPLPERPADALVVRWYDAMPQYELGHVERVARIRHRLPGGIFVTGQPYDGVGVPDCVRAAGETAEAVTAHLERSTRTHDAAKTPARPT